MNTIVSFFKSFYSYLCSLAPTISIMDVIDILLLAFVFYFVYRFIRERRAGRLALGILIFILILILANILGLRALGYILGDIGQAGVLALVILFQPELRAGLETVGREPLKSLRMIGEPRDATQILHNIDEIVSAVMDMAESHTGALLVIEGQTRIGEIIKTGTVIEAKIGSSLIKNLFFNKAPLHDGAVIVRDGTLYAAGCFLPLSNNDSIVKDLGTRHRSAIGMSENSDALVICVSEETGTVSVALSGKLTQGYDAEHLKDLLINTLLSETYREKIGKIRSSGKEERADAGKESQNRKGESK